MKINLKLLQRLGGAMRVTLTLSLPPMPKMRARVTSNGTFHVQHYQNWMRSAVGEFSSQWQGNPTLQAIQKLSIQFWGNSARGDIDNFAGSVMDALVKAQVIANDGVNNIPHLETAWERIGKQEQPRIEVILELAPAPPEKPARKGRKSKAVVTQ